MFNAPFRQIQRDGVLVFIAEATDTFGYFMSIGHHWCLDLHFILFFKVEVAVHPGDVVELSLQVIVVIP